ncbi:charged multivesicular body protein 6-A-like [Artemia franciscana]|uniref:charged multivesicular body protein 6-A-like n=1 Tax=Artemia franciscana TaxID=6661 RepID=UPI0032D9F309
MSLAKYTFQSLFCSTSVTCDVKIKENHVTDRKAYDCIESCKADARIAGTSHGVIVTNVGISILSAQQRVLDACLPVIPGKGKGLFLKNETFRDVSKFLLDQLSELMNRVTCLPDTSGSCGPTLSRAKILLKKKRYLEQLTEKTDNQLDGIEQMVQDIEFSQVQVEVLKNLEKGNAALKKLHDVFSMSDVEKIMDETREGIEKQQEIDDLLSGNLTEDDLAAVEDELNEIMKANLPEVENLPEVPTEEPTLPDIPQGEPKDVPTRKEKTKQEKIALTA